MKRINLKSIGLFCFWVFAFLLALGNTSVVKAADKCTNQYPSNACVNIGTVSDSSQCVSGLCSGNNSIKCCPLNLVTCNSSSIGQQCSANGNYGICNAAGNCVDAKTGAIGSITTSSSTASSPSGSGSTCATCFTNPLAFSSVEDFLTNGLLVAMQRIIVVLSLVMIIYGALLYITSGVTSQTESAKKVITAALTGLAIGIAAPSILKELSSILGWNSTTNAAVAAAPSFTIILTNVLNFMLGIAGIISLVMIVIGAIMYLTSVGDDKQVETGKKIFRYSLMGLVIAMSAMILVTQIAKFFAFSPTASVPVSTQAQVQNKTRTSAGEVDMTGL